MTAEKPTDVEIKIFCDAFELLAKFEAEQRMIRNYGCFNMKDVESIQPVCAKVIGWLKAEQTALGQLAKLRSAWAGGGRRALIDAYDKLQGA